MIVTSRAKFFILIQVILIFLFKSTCKNILNHIIHSFLMLSTLCFGVRNQSLDAETWLGINQILRQNWDSNHQWPIGYSRKRKQLNKNRKLYGDEVGTSTNRSGGCKMFANKWERITVFLPLEIWGLKLNLIQHFYCSSHNTKAFVTVQQSKLIRTIWSIFHNLQLCLLYSSSVITNCKLQHTDLIHVTKVLALLRLLCFLFLFFLFGGGGGGWGIKNIKNKNKK